MSKLRWLHLSDFHFDAAMRTDSYDAGAVLRPLTRWIAERRSVEGPVDLLLITGDIGNKAQPGDYDIALRFLQEIREVAGVAQRDVWVVPGNHDVDRSRGRALLRTLTTEEESSTWFFAAPSSRESHLGKFLQFRQFMADYLPDRRFADGDVVHEPDIFATDGLKLGILPLNSAWFSNDDDDRGKLWIGGRLVRERAETLRGIGAEVILGLAHHPLADLHESDTAGAWIKNECDIFLRGHLHSAEVEAIASEAGSLLEIAAGATYQGSFWPCRAFMGSLDWQHKTVSVEPIRYVGNPAANTWVLDVEAFPGRAHQGYIGVFDLRSSSGVARVGSRKQFPHSDWTAVNRVNWLSAIVDWFSANYSVEPQPTMAKLLAHVAQILEYSASQPNLGSALENLGKALIPLAERADTDPEVAYHVTILRLLAFGLNRDLSHLFMLPIVDLDAMLEVPDYSRLLLATRQLGAGRFDVASKLALEVSGCCVALYVMAQCDRKAELNHEADSKFVSLQRLIDLIDEPRRHAYPCTASRDLRCMCNRDLLRASVGRARGVVARRLGDIETAKRYFDLATSAAMRALESISDQRSAEIGRSELAFSYDRSPFEVLADVNYSHGYFWYEQREFDRAAALFLESIKALGSGGSEDSWDSPYTRLGIVYLVQDDLVNATSSAIRARNICKATPAGSNREAPLSLALNTLTLRVIEAKAGSQLLAREANALLELNAALGLDPPLALGPLSCHRKDANLIRTKCDSADISGLVEEFVLKLEEAEREVYSEHRRSS